VPDKMLRIGSVLHGYCNGYFGRDGYGAKRVEAIGADWLVARDICGIPTFAQFKSQEELERLTEEWLKEKQEPEDE
jgi:hypothetical protein